MLRQGPSSCLSHAFVTGAVHVVSANTINSSFQAVDAKSIRVSVSSFYDYLTVSLKCLQEFDNDDS